MLKPKILFAVALALLLTVLVIQNSEVVTVTLLFWKVEMSRVILILFTTLAGFMGGYVVAKLTGSPRPRPDRPAT